jgi:hypothetical protein
MDISNKENKCKTPNQGLELVSLAWNRKKDEVMDVAVRLPSAFHRLVAHMVARIHSLASRSLSVTKNHAKSALTMVISVPRSWSPSQ